MRFALMIEPQQGLTYAEQLAIAQRAEAAGFETFFRSDHYQSFPGAAGEPTTDAWAVARRPRPRDRPDRPRERSSRRSRSGIPATSPRSSRPSTR